MAQTRVVTYPESGGRKLEITDLNVVIRDSIFLWTGEVYSIEIPLDDFKGLKFIIEGFNSAENQYILKEYSVIARSSDVMDNCYNVLGSSNINFSTEFSIIGTNLIVDISNLNEFDLQVEIVRIVIG